MSAEDLAEFAANEAAYRELLASLSEARRAARQGGPPSAHERHRRRGRIPVRERVELLLDAGSP